jgi:hypothetical protein
MTNDEYIKKSDEILLQVPIEFRSVLDYMAYEKGHAFGYDEVIGILEGLVNSLSPAIVEFETRIIMRPHGPE